MWSAQSRFPVESQQASGLSAPREEGIMKVYLANVESWTFPNQGSERLCQKGLIEQPRFRAEVARRCRQNAARYDVNGTAEKLAGLIAQSQTGRIAAFRYRPTAGHHKPTG
jgi:hypothetical protein